MEIKKTSIIILAVFLFTDISLARALADDPIVDIFPSNGSVTTKIYLQIRCGNMQDGILYMYWDGLPLLRGVPQDTEFGPIRYDLTFYPPTDSPFSDKGDHIIKIEIFYEIIVSLGTTRPTCCRLGCDRLSCNLCSVNIYLLICEISNLSLFFR